MSRPHFIKALSSLPESSSDYKQSLEQTLSTNEQLTAALARKNAELRSLRAKLEQIQARLASLADGE